MSHHSRCHTSRLRRPTETEPITLMWVDPQERLLARRTLHFLDTEVVWECRSEYWCECLTYGFDLKWKPQSQKLSRFSQALFSSSNSGFDLTLWQNLVAEYSTWRLTKIGDMLPALRGMAGKFEMKLGRYYASLQQEIFELQLLWQANLSKKTQLGMIDWDQTRS